MINAQGNLHEDIITKHTEKLKQWLGLLKDVMPDYFFQTFNSQKIQELLPALFNIHHQSGIQQITSENSVTFIYLQSEANNLVTTANIMKKYDIVGAFIHKSKKELIVDGIPRTLVIEYYTINDASLKMAPVYPLKEVSKAYKAIFKTVDPELDEIYNRIIWDEVKDLTIDKLATRLDLAIKAQKQDRIKAEVEKAGSEIRLTMSFSNCPSKGFFCKIIECLALNGFTVNRAYLRDFTFQNDVKDMYRMPVVINTIYLEQKEKSISLNSKKMKDAIEELCNIKWITMDDMIHDELVMKKGWTLSQANLIRAASEFIHSQFSFIDRNAYNYHDVVRFMMLYDNLLKDLFELFEVKFKPETSGRDVKIHRLEKKITQEIETINTGMLEKDMLTKNVFRALLNFINSILKTNFYVPMKSALSFRMDVAFMNFYEKLSPAYGKSFPAHRPYGTFYFYRDKCVGFQVRFSEIARGGWRTVIPRTTGNELEMMDSYEFAKDEIFREVYVLAHTQHMKNKDIYEGGAKMICLLNSLGVDNQKAMLFEAQRTVASAFLDLINYDSKGKLKKQEIVDYLGKQEIIEIGPDENMFDEMISWMGTFAEEAGYTLGGGLISGKPETGVNHKDYGVTSFGVHQYLLKTLEELKINPLKDKFSVKISGGPFGDVAGNEIKLLLQKEKNAYVYPHVKIVAITDGPAAAYDPDGLDKEELAAMVKTKNLDHLTPEKLKGEGAYIIYSKPEIKDGIEKYSMILKKNKNLEKKLISRDEFMKIFQDNLMVHCADIFIPCGGRPSTINMSNWANYLVDGVPSSKAIIEGANSFITPEARIALQEKGVWIVKDASANKCGVITSSYEILSGLMLSKEEFIKQKNELVPQIMDILRERARKEAEWLYYNFRKTGKFMTELTDQLSMEINYKNSEVSKYIDTHKNLIKPEIILSHLPKLFAKLDKSRIDRIPYEYKKAIVSVELACRIVYGGTQSLEHEINSVL